MFDFEKIENFNEHINLSIPNYSGLNDIVESFIYEYTNPQGSLLDIGCSDGTLLNKLKKREDIKYIGCDIVDIAKIKNFEYIKGDATKVIDTIKNIDVIVSLFTLQFMGKYKRQKMLKKIKRVVDNNNAIFIIAEKVFFSA